MKKILVAIVCAGAFSAHAVVGPATGGSGTPGGSSGQIQYNNSGSFAGIQAMNGDCTWNLSTGAITCTKSNGLSFASGAFSSAYSLPLATSSVLGGVKPDGTTITNTVGAISVTYGTAANTAAQGNDSRITGAVQSGGALGTPSSGTLTNVTGLPATGVVNTAVTLTDTQTLTNKTLTAPTISNPVITGSGVTFTSGTSRTIANAAEIIVCTGTCTITPPSTLTPGAQFCVQNDDNISTVITLAASATVQYENATTRASYGASNKSMTSGGAIKDQICMVAISTTKYNVFSSTGTWTNTP